MKANHQVQTPPINTDLQFLNPSPSAQLSIVGKQVLRDLQVKISDLVDIIKNAKPAPHTFTQLLLTPELGEEEHIVYKISVVPTSSALAAVTLIANPSPPKGAV